MTHRQSENPGPVTQREIRTVFAGLMIALSLSALDMNIVGTALPRIVSDLGGLSQLSWVVTAYMLASTVTTPLYGKLSDMYGRKRLFAVAITLFLLGSCLCGISQTMKQLVAFRGIQGLGAGGLLTLAQTTIGDLIAPRDRGRYQGLIGSVFAFFSICGPLLGGFITDLLSWRWIFYVNVPVGMLALALILFGFKRRHRTIARNIDYAGIVWLSCWTSSLLLVLTWGGVVYPWSSPLILALAGGSALSFVFLVRQEHRALEPILSPRLFRNKIFVIAACVIGLTFMSLRSASIFMPLFFQLVMGLSATRAGLMMAPLTFAIIVSSVLGGRLVSRTGRYKIFPVMGLIFAAAALFGITWASAARVELLLFVVGLSLLGFGFGFVMPNLTVAIQNAVEFDQLGMATATATFFRSLGGAFGVALSGAILTSRLSHLSSFAGGRAGGRSLIVEGMQQVAQLPPQQKEMVLTLYREAIGATFLTGAVVALVGFAIVGFLPERPLRTTVHSDPALPEASPAVPETEGAILEKAG